MRYYAQYNESGKLLAIGTGHGGVEITEAEYTALLSEIREKASLVNQLYSGEITLADVPEAWQEEVQRRVEEHIQMEAKYEPEATEEDYISALSELGVTL